MARDDARAKRDQAIIDAAAFGFPRRALAEMTGLTAGRVQQIVDAAHDRPNLQPALRMQRERRQRSQQLAELARDYARRPSRGLIVRVRLAPGVTPERAIAEIRQVAGSKGGAIRTGSQHPVDRRDDYVRWSLDAEVDLLSVLHRADAESFFDGPRHRDICSMAPGNQLTPSIEAELNDKVQDLNTAASYLEGHLRRMRRSSGLPIVIDSNVLLQCQRLDYVDWQLLELNESARVMVPLRVLEEIDARKYSDGKRLRAIARGLLPWIDALFPGGPEPVELREGATIELLLADRPRYRPSDADEEILDVCHDVLQFAGRGKLMTGDTGLRARATSEGLEVVRCPRAGGAPLRTQVPPELDRGEWSD